MIKQQPADNLTTRRARVISGTKRALLYSAFAALALLANLAAQFLVFEWYSGPYQLVVAILLGTIVGLPVKYLLDQRYIFRFEPQNLRERGSVFVKYTVFSGLTTLIFWGFEALFEVWYGNQNMTLLGGAIGLTIGYAVKYRLDKHFVFARKAGAENGPEQ